jgi:hypothetical protein
VDSQAHRGTDVGRCDSLSNGEGVAMSAMPLWAFGIAPDVSGFVTWAF